MRAGKAKASSRLKECMQGHARPRQPSAGRAPAAQAGQQAASGPSHKPTVPASAYCTTRLARMPAEKWSCTTQ